MQLIELRRSRSFAALKWAAFGVTAGTGVWLALAGVSSLTGWLAAAVVVLLGLPALRVQLPQGALRLRPEGFCEWFARDAGASAAATDMTVAGLFEAGGWLVLRLAERHGAGRRGLAGRATLTLVLAPDAAAPGDLRCLRVWLRLAAPRAALNSGNAQWS